MAADVRHEIWKMEIPLPRAFGTPSGPFERVFAVALRLRDGDGTEGVAYAQMNNAGALHRVADIMAALLAERGGDLDRLIQIERLDSGVTGDQPGRSAVCAISMAAWDLLGPSPQPAVRGALERRTSDKARRLRQRPLLAALPTSLPVEVFDWWHPVFAEEPEPDAQGRLAVQGRGLERSLNTKSLQHYGRSTEN